MPQLVKQEQGHDVAWIDTAEEEEKEEEKEEEEMEKRQSPQLEGSHGGSSLLFLYPTSISLHIFLKLNQQLGGSSSGSSG